MPPHTLTRRRFLLGLGGGLAGAVLAACGLEPPAASPSVQSSHGAEASTAPSRASSPSPTQAVPDLRARIAQMLLVGFRGLAVEDAANTVADITERSLGGVVLFSFDTPTGSRVRNVASPEQLRALTDGLRAAAVESPAGMPLLVAIDEEGGQVARLGPDHGFPATRSAADLGALDDADVTRQAGRDIADTLAAAGIDTNLAPVVDLDLNPANPIIGALDRSFSADPEVVVRQASAFVEGHREAGVRTCLKHFPGHGSAAGDTHQGVVDVTDVWSRMELEPFRRLADAGLADAILTAHVFNATLDPSHPATLSRATIGGILRAEIGYDGVVVSDDMQMGAIRDAFGYPEAVELAINAGVDILTIANQQVYEEGIVAETVEIIASAVAAGRISEARIDEAWGRISALKNA
jgi:beta-N-acetylhexosaminidase